MIRDGVLSPSDVHSRRSDVYGVITFLYTYRVCFFDLILSSLYFPYFMYDYSTKLFN